MNNVPHDALDPDFEDRSRVHDWKNYTTDRLEHYWDLFSPAQKSIIAECLQDMADKEEWE